MDTKKHIIDLESFRDILHICPRVPGQLFVDPPFEEEILAFIRFLRHSAAIRTLTNVIINKLYQPWRSFAALINKCLTGKSSGYDSLRLSQAQILIKLVSRYQNAQQFGAMLPIELTNDEIRNSKAYKEYYAIAKGEATPKPKASVRKTRSSSDTSITPPTATASPRPKASAKEEELSWNSTDDEGDDNEGKDGDDDEEDEGNDGKEGNGNDDDDEIDADEEGGDDEQESDEETKEEESFDPTHKPLKTVKTKAMGKGLQGTLEVEDTHVTLTPVKPDGQQESSSVSSQFVTSMLYLTLDVGIESIFETTSRTNVQTPTSVTPLPITTLTMTSSTIATTTPTSQAPTLPTTILSEIIQNLPSFALLFRFDDRLRSFEQNFSEVMQTNQFAGAVFAIPRIVQQYIDKRMNKAVQVAVQLQSDWLREEAQRENDEFLRTAMNEQLEAEVLTRSSHSSRTSHVVAADLSKIELKKILIEKMEGNKSIQRSDEQKNLYKALVNDYESDKIILDTYGETVTLKRRRDDDEDKDEEPSVGLDRGSKRCREGKEPKSASTPSKTATKSAGRSTTGSRSRQALASESAFAEELVQTTSQLEEPSHLKFEIGADDQPIIQSFQHLEWFSRPQKPLSPDRDWNKTLLAVHGSIQPWISELTKLADTYSSFNELINTPLDFSNFIMNWLRVDTLTSELLAGPTYDLMKGSCKSMIELEYHLEEVYKATTDQLDWVNHEGQPYPYNLLQPLLLIPDNRGRRVIPFAHFIDNDLEYLWGGASSWKYSTSVTKTKTADYGHIKWIKDLFYGFAVNRESARDVYSKRRIIAITKLKIVEWHSYKNLDWIMVRRDDDKLYKFKEGNYKRLRIQYIEDMLLLLVQGNLTNLTVEERFAFNVSLQMFTRSIVIQRRVEDLQLGVESYQKRLNLTKPDTYRPDLKHKEAYTAYSNP
uniref:Uncharacterized protein n=1 Tax=Tanacetum cinerariifolium TaxID=118510 RepID=A0A699I425_TANCI|nr:hypothetical protein [Tanacetum cinerariifolium]